MSTESDIAYIFKQLDNLTGQAEMGGSVDPQAFGELKGAVTALKTDVDDLANQIKALTASVTALAAQMSEAKGGWRMLMLLGGAGATLGGLVTYFLTHTISISPKG